MVSCGCYTDVPFFLGGVSFAFGVRSFIWISYGSGTHILKLEYVKSQTRKLVPLLNHLNIPHDRAYNCELGNKCFTTKYLALISHRLHISSPLPPPQILLTHLTSYLSILLPPVFFVFVTECDSIFAGVDMSHVRWGAEDSREEENKTHPRRCGYWGWMFTCQIGCFAP